MRASIVILSLLLMLHGGGFAQTLTGRITDSLHIPLADVAVTLVRLPQLTILRYTVTQKDGNFQLMIRATDTGDLRLSVRLFGYRAVSMSLSAGRSRYDLVLFPEADSLPEATVNAGKPYILTNGDTTSYSARDFAHATDRTIGEVLRRMPGIDVDNTGKIFYNGMAVSAFYIDGDNLLDDRYNIGTTSIPHTIVDKVQVIEKNEPIRVRSGHGTGTETAINITLRDSAQRPVDQLALAGGLPHNFDANVSNLLFRHRYKALNQVKANNVGLDYHSDLIAFNQQAVNTQTGDPLPDPLLSLTGLGYPPIEARRYLFNNTGILNTNNLFHLNRKWQLKVKASGLFDRQTQQLYNSTTVVLGTGSVTYSQNNSDTLRPRKLFGEVSLSANQNDFYFLEKLQVQDSRDEQAGTLVTNSETGSQRLKIELTDFTNELHLIRRLKGGMTGELYSYTSNWRLPQQYGLTDSGSLLQQTVRLPAFYTNNFVGLTKPALVTQTYKAGVAYQSQELDTRLLGQTASDSGVNDLVWHRYRAYGSAQYDYVHSGKTSRASLLLPVSWLSTRISNVPMQQNQTIFHFYFEPELNVQLSPDGQQALRLRAVLSNEPGTILNFYSGYILRDYRTLEANNSSFHTSLQQYELGYTLREPAKLLFVNAGIKYSSIASGNTPDVRVNDSLSVLNTVIPPVRTANSVEFNTGISRYFFRLSSTISVSYQYKYVRSNQIFNGGFLPFSNYTQLVAFRISTRLPDNFDLSYAGIFTRLTGEAADGLVKSPSATSTALNQKLQLSFLPNPVVLLKSAVEDLYSPVTGQPGGNCLFIDAAVQYKLQRIHTDLELSVTNLADSRTYRITQLTTNSIALTSYPLRSRIVLLKAIFNL